LKKPYPLIDYKFEFEIEINTFPYNMYICEIYYSYAIPVRPEHKSVGAMEEWRKFRVFSLPLNTKYEYATSKNIITIITLKLSEATINTYQNKTKTLILFVR